MPVGMTSPAALGPAPPAARFERGVGGVRAGRWAGPAGSPEYRAVEEIWYQGLAVMASRGAFLILDEVFLAGGAGQQRLKAVLGDLDVLWAGVHCDPLVAAEREAASPDRVRGMAMTQAVAACRCRLRRGGRHHRLLSYRMCPPDS
jgi:chloramphenicol 3-O-phosphotransferase